MTSENILKVEDTLACYNSGLISKSRRDELLRTCKLKSSKFVRMIFGNNDLVTRFNSNWKYALGILNQYKVPYDTRGSIILNIYGDIYRLSVSSYGYTIVQANLATGRFEVKNPVDLNRQGLLNFIASGGYI